MKGFDEKEFYAVCKRLNMKPYIEDITIKYQYGDFFYRIKRNVNTDRRGEVVFCVIRPNGRYIATTCAEYPEGIYRIPTGGIGHDEDIMPAVYREAREELGLEVEITDFAGVLKIRFEHRNEVVMFYSYLFILKETGGRLLIDACDREISGIMETDLDGLQTIVSSLADIPGRWNDWGKFRYATSNAVLKHLQRKCNV